MTCTEDRGGAIIDMDTTTRDLGDVRGYLACEHFNGTTDQRPSYPSQIHFWILARNLFGCSLNRGQFQVRVAPIVNDDSGVLVSKSIFAGLSFPAIYLLTCSIIIIALPVFGIVVQAKNQFPTLAKKLSVAIMLPLTLLTVWWAGNSMFRYLGELLWSYHD